MAQQTKAAARTLPREPSLPRQSESSCRISAYVCLHNEHKGFALHFFFFFLIYLFFFSFSILAQSLVHPKPEPDRPSVGERYTQPLSICGYYHPGAHLRLPEA